MNHDDVCLVWACMVASTMTFAIMVDVVGEATREWERDEISTTIHCAPSVLLNMLLSSQRMLHEGIHPLVSQQAIINS